MHRRTENSFVLCKALQGLQGNCSIITVVIHGVKDSVLLLFWFKHILFMKKRVGRGLKRDKSPLLEGLFTREHTHTHSHTEI